MRKLFNIYDMKARIEQCDVHFLKIQVYMYALKTKLLYMAHTTEKFWVRHCVRQPTSVNRTNLITTDRNVSVDH